jgi:hypothetical protein
MRSMMPQPGRDGGRVSPANPPPSTLGAEDDRALARVAARLTRHRFGAANGHRFAM